jgi:non-ribosomal peptide synthetase component F
MLVEWNDTQQDYPQDKSINYLLDILKAGGTYVPLDPTYPQDRISYLEDANVHVQLTHSSLIYHSFPSTKTRIKNP